MKVYYLLYYYLPVPASSILTSHLFCDKQNFFQINDPQKILNIKLIHLFALSMLEGNKIHDDLKSNNLIKHINLTVPEAIAFGGKQTEKATEWVKISKYIFHYTYIFNVYLSTYLSSVVSVFSLFYEENYRCFIA